MRRPHERQPCRLSLTLPRAGPGHLRPTHGKREDAPSTRFGQAQGRRGACNWANGQPPPPSRRSALVTFVGLRAAPYRSLWFSWGCVQAFRPKTRSFFYGRGTPGGFNYAQDLDGDHWADLRVVSCCEGGCCQREFLRHADHRTQDTQGSHRRGPGILTWRPEKQKEKENRTRTLRSVFFAIVIVVVVVVAVVVAVVVDDVNF